MPQLWKVLVVCGMCVGLNALIGFIEGAIDPDLSAWMGALTGVAFGATLAVIVCLIAEAIWIVRLLCRRWGP